MITRTYLVFLYQWILTYWIWICVDMSWKCWLIANVNFTYRIQFFAVKCSLFSLLTIMGSQRGWLLVSDIRINNKSIQGPTYHLSQIACNRSCSLCGCGPRELYWNYVLVMLWRLWNSSYIHMWVSHMSYMYSDTFIMLIVSFIFMMFYECGNCCLTCVTCGVGFVLLPPCPRVRCILQFLDNDIVINIHNQKIKLIFYEVAITCCQLNFVYHFYVYAELLIRLLIRIRHHKHSW